MKTSPPRRRRCRRRAFTMPELLIAMGILAIFAVAASRLFQSTIRIGQAAAQQQDAANSFDSAVAALRADVWGATEITSADASTAKLGDVTWTIDGTTLARDAGGGSTPRRWSVPQATTFAVDGAALVVHVPAKGGERGGELRLVSEIAVLTRLKA